MLKGARNTDPTTSHDAWQNVKVKAGTQRHFFLMVYAYANKALCSEEAYERALKKKLAVTPYAYWKRISELQQLGLIKYADEIRKAKSGAWQKCYVITDAGRKVLQNI